jgi:hypothetical protein
MAPFLTGSLEASRRVTNDIPLGWPPFVTSSHCNLRPNTEGTLTMFGTDADALLIRRTTQEYNESANAAVR